MKTTIDLAEELLRAAEGLGGREGRSLEDVMATALRAHVLRSEPVPPGEEAWRRAFGTADPRGVRGRRDQTMRSFDLPEP